jgi:hypothetical protein
MMTCESVLFVFLSSRRFSASFHAFRCFLPGRGCHSHFPSFVTIARDLQFTTISFNKSAIVSAHKYILFLLIIVNWLSDIWHTLAGNADKSFTCFGCMPSNLSTCIPSSESAKNLRRVCIHTSSFNCGNLLLTSTRMDSSMPAVLCAHCNWHLSSFPSSLDDRMCFINIAALAAPCSANKSFNPIPPMFFGPYTIASGVFLL